MDSTEPSRLTRSRSKPRKIIAATDSLDAFTVSEPRKPGRPRKHRLPADTLGAQTFEEKQANDTQIRRKCGRPRKESTSEGLPKVRRPRGRPCKESPGEELPKRRVGRPRKNTSSSNETTEILTYPRRGRRSKSDNMLLSDLNIPPKSSPHYIPSDTDTDVPKDSFGHQNDNKVDEDDEDHEDHEDHGDDEDDEDYSYDYSNDDEYDADELEYDYDDDDDDDKVEKDEVDFLLRDQHMDISDGLPTLYYPTITNRLYANIRSIQVRHIYTILLYVISSFVITMVVTQLSAIRSENGYCTSVNDGNISTMLCISCPKHATCINGQLSCNPLYRPHRSFVNKAINSIWPIGAICVKDPSMTGYIKQMEKEIVNTLARRQAKVRCSTVTHSINKNGTPALAKSRLSDIMDYLHSVFVPSATNQHQQIELDHAVQQAVTNIMENQDILTWKTDNEVYLATNLTNYSFKCWLWVSLWQTPKWIMKSFVTLFAGYSLFLFLRYVYHRYYRARLEVQTKLEKALDMLKKQREQHFASPGENRPGCTANEIRSTIMGEDITRPGIWKSVLCRLQQHPSVRTGQAFENGEPDQYFEYS